MVRSVIRYNLEGGDRDINNVQAKQEGLDTFYCLLLGTIDNPYDILLGEVEIVDPKRRTSLVAIYWEQCPLPNPGHYSLINSYLH
jgi:hypothetical protein